MKILQISDTHIGITSPRTLQKLFKKIAQEDFDVLLHCGDYCGGVRGYRSVRTTVSMIREVMPDKSFVSVLGNHDYWHEGQRKSPPAMHTFVQNLGQIKEALRENDAHFLDKDGPYLHPDFPDVILVGHTGWYNHAHPPTNDHRWLPQAVEGNTHIWMQRNARKELFNNLDELDQFYKPGFHTVCFVSHFPVVKVEPDQNFELFSWDGAIQTLMQESYNCRHFFNGHAHRLHKGPLRYESGSDYYNPKYHIVEV